MITIRPTRLCALLPFLLAAACGEPSAPPNENPSGGDDAADGDPSPDSPPPDSSPWRPFSDASPWNTPIAADPGVRADSDELIEALATSSEWQGLFVNIEPWSIPLYRVGSGTPLVEVHASLSTEGQDVTLRWPVPAGAEPATEADGHLALVDVEGGRGYDFFQARPRGDGSWDCTLCATVDLNGDGVRPPKGSPGPWYESHGSRACGFPLVAGLIRVDELRSGHIDHALVIAYPGIRQRWFTSPASTGHPANGRISEYEGVPCGGRIQLDPSLDVDELGLSEAGRTIARALQEYGAYVGDYSDSVNLYADGSPDARSAWEGVLAAETMRSLDLRRLRVLEWGTMRPDG